MEINVLTVIIIMLVGTITSVLYGIIKSKKFRSNNDSNQVYGNSPIPIHIDNSEDLISEVINSEIALCTIVDENNV